MLLALVALTAAGADLSGDPWQQALAMVDDLAWALSDEQLTRWMEGVPTARGPFAASWREGWVVDSDRVAGREPSGYAGLPTSDRLEGAPVYAVEASLDDDARRLSVREAVVWTNTSDEARDQLVFRLAPAAATDPPVPGREPEILPVGPWRVWVDGKRARAELTETLLVVDLPEPVAPRRSSRVLIELDHLQIPPFRDHDGYVDRIDALDTGAWGQAEGVLNLGFALPLLTASVGGDQDRRPMPVNGEHTWFDPASFHLILEVPARMVVATTGVELGRRTSGGRTAIRVVAAGVRELGIEASPDWSVAERDVGGVRLRAYHRRWEPQAGVDLLTYAASSLALFESLWGPVPYREIDVVDAPIRVAAGMEFPQLVTVDLSEGGGYRASTEHRWTVAHEIAHQWWYSDVGTDPRVEPWVDEALATQGAVLHEASILGDAVVREQLRRELVAPYEILAREGATMLPASAEAERYDLQQYGLLIYGKAPLFLEEVRRALGDERYHGALRAFREAHHLRAATAADLLGSLREAAPEPEVIDDLYRRWMVEVHGYEALLPVELGVE